MPEAPPTDIISTRIELQRVATHILARARFLADGRFGLRPTVGGIGTPAFGAEGEIIRISGDRLVREHRTGSGPRTTVIGIDGHSLHDLAAFAGVDLDMPFHAGTDAPPPGEPGTPIAVSRTSCDAVLSWYRLTALALDGVLPLLVDPSVAQLWPEHFDIALDSDSAHGRVNLGGSPGDDGHPDPYLYVGPWGPDRPGESTFWNAPFGAVLDQAEFSAAGDAVETATSFFRKGLLLLG